MDEAATTWELTPHEGLGPVRLGVPRAQARAAMAAAGFAPDPGAWPDETDRFQGSPLCCTYGDDGLVQFIEVASHDTGLRVRYRGVDVFDTGARKLFGLIARADGSGDHAYDREGYRFPGQILTLWGADRQYDHRGGRKRAVWAAVGLGNADYLAAIARIDDELDGQHAQLDD